MNKFPEFYNLKKKTNFQKIFNLKLQKLTNFEIVCPLDIPHHLQFYRFSYLLFYINEFRGFIFSIFIFYCSYSHKFGRSTFERSLIFKFEMLAILHPSPLGWGLKFWTVKLQDGKHSTTGYKHRNSFISKGKYENRQNCEWCGISNGQTFPWYVNFFNFDNFPNWKNSENLLVFQVVKFWIFQFREFFKFPIYKIPKISNL